MKLYFRPMPWLSGIVLAMMALLISLGVWQYQRLQWKTALLAEVEASVNAPPLTSLDDLARAISAGEPVDFRRIAFRAQPIAGTPIYAVYHTQKGGIFWDLFQGVEGPPRIFVKYARVPDADKPDEKAIIAVDAQPQSWVGYVRKDHAMGRVEAWVKSAPNLDENRWFKFNQLDLWEDGAGTDIEAEDNIIMSHYIESAVIDGAAVNKAASQLPVRRPTIRNNHRDYMLTWFSFAGLLLTFYGLIHIRAGRLSL